MYPLPEKCGHEESYWNSDGCENVCGYWSEYMSYEQCTETDIDYHNKVHGIVDTPSGGEGL